MTCIPGSSHRRLPCASSTVFRGLRNVKREFRKLRKLWLCGLARSLPCPAETPAARRGGSPRQAVSLDAGSVILSLEPVDPLVEAPLVRGRVRTLPVPRRLAGASDRDPDPRSGEGD